MCLPLAERMLPMCTGLRQRLRKLVFVGCVTLSHSLVQEDTRLLLLDMGTLSKDLFCQLVCADLVYGLPNLPSTALLAS